MRSAPGSCTLRRVGSSLRVDDVRQDVPRPEVPRQPLVRTEPQGRGPGLLGFLTLGALLVAGTGAGTWAAFSASTTSAAGFSTGTLVLEHTVVARDGLAVSDTPCDSADGGDTSTNAATCSDLFTPDPRAVAIGGSASAVVVLENVGSIEAPEFQVHADGPCTTGTGGGYAGTGDLCDALRLEIVELTGESCQPATGAGCTDVVRLAEEPLSTFGSSRGTFTTAVSLGSLPSATSRAFRVSMEMPTPAGDPDVLQGLTATAGVTWRVTT